MHTSTRRGRILTYLVSGTVALGPIPATAGPILDRALEMAAASTLGGQQTAAVSTTECLLATSAGTTEGRSEASFRYFGHGMIMPFYAVGKARQSPAEPPAEIMARYSGQLGECFADGYRDSRRRARAVTAWYGTFTTVSLLASFLLIPKLMGGDDYDYTF